MEPKKPVNNNSTNTNSNTKPPINIGSSKPQTVSGNSFAARMAALQAKMGGNKGGGSSTTSSNSKLNTNKEPSKPIVELCEGNTKRMDINKIIGNLEKEQKKKETTSSKPVHVKIVSGKGKGIPPPPPPPPPPKI